MYNSNLDWCDCDRDRVEGIEDMMVGSCKIKDGIECAKAGLKKICKCRVREGVKDVCTGLCKMEKGVCCVMNGLDAMGDNGCSEGQKRIKAGVCDVKEGMKCIKKGLDEICNCGVCKANEMIQRGLNMVENGLCNIVEGGKDVLNDQDIKKKHECEMPCENKCEEMDPCRRCGTTDFSDVRSNFDFDRPTWKW